MLIVCTAFIAININRSIGNHHQILGLFPIIVIMLFMLIFIFILNTTIAITITVTIIIIFFFSIILSLFYIIILTTTAVTITTTIAIIIIISSSITCWRKLGSDSDTRRVWGVGCPAGRNYAERPDSQRLAGEGPK